eukprot:Plantae.Rhodophyta-Purpureofilum_apyrenoidigerum.ctg3796.p1 GENE.Plantae.Rhodophyta-Purpureofilum_apyrenoidigerum.ctg3796~~Plantae.Rhodophyta-Purpureofilum_apyrenoidigerum.ctg3796.p1  ORF type:complete len:651 (-),score=118.46 Plantae.Rhodophyta-Purpureofilum_apyrenoidigerum.ctg3796:96-2048(-)
MEDELLRGVVDRKHLVRERSLQRLRSLLSTWKGEEVSAFAAALKNELPEARSWEARTGILLAAGEIIKADKLKDEMSAFAESIEDVALECMANSEVRLRSAAGEVLGACAKALGSEAWRKCSPSLVQGIENNFNLDAKQRKEQAAQVVEATEGLKKRTDLVHESEGWRNLDTSLAACVHVIDACGSQVMVDPQVEKLRDFALQAREHPNRFIRETSLKLLTSLIVAASESDKARRSENAVKDIAPKIARSIAIGLEDNWSQVRYASSVCVRELITRSPEDVKESLYGLLIPRMCLNRHYVAEGVRTYSQDTWKNVLGSKGRKLLVKYFPEVIDFYISQCDADNHAVREAACQSLAEAAIKIEPSVVKPKVAEILSALLVCFRDESWPVRDCACTASAAITEKFPQDVEESNVLADLVSLWFAHIADNIPSVRENSAISLAKAAAAYGPDHPVCGLEAVIEKCRQLLPSVKSQQQNSERYGVMGNSTQYGAAHKLARDNDEDLHTGQTMYSCGSLAPKLRKGGGCMDHGFTRHKEPWEETDGALRLWRQLTCRASDLGSPLLPLVADIASSELLFAHAPYLLETLWYQVEAASNFVDEDTLMKELPKLTPSMKKCTICGHKLTEAAAASAERALRRRVGIDAMQAATATIA